MQGGDLDRPRPLGRIQPWSASKTGRITRMDGQKIGEAVIAMGGGRTFAGQSIDHSVGLCFEKRLGDTVQRGDVVVHVLCNHTTKAESAMNLLDEAIAIEEATAANAAVPPILWRDFA
jgi:thymidine phosphorylase